MSTSSSSLASTVSSLTAPASFSGVSKFATSLQQVLTRAVGIASLPLNTLQASLATSQNQQSAVNSLGSTFSALQQSVTSLQTAVNSTLLQSSVSDASVVSANVAAGALAGTYSIEVDNLGSYSTALSAAGATAVSDPTAQGISSSASFTLTVGAQSTTITPASASLQDLVSAINSQAAGQVQATVVNVGSTSSPDYRLSLQASSLGSDAIDLQDNSATSVISTSTAGVLASYKLNESSTPITSDSRKVTLSPGLTATLVGQSVSGQSAVITVADNATGLASAFQSFANSYNNAVTTLAQHQGQTGSAIAGDSLIQSLSGVLSQLGNYSSGSATTALANYGITLDQSGQLSVDTKAFSTAANADFPTLLSTLGGAATGGFLKTATDLLKGVEDATTGLIPTESTQLTNQITTQQAQIAQEQARVNTLQTNLTAEISKADSTIASLESQVSYVTGLFAQYTGALSTQSNGLSTL
jgi:flagellar hook-associated protein 2